VLELVDIPALIRLYRLSTRRLGKIYGVAARPDFISAVAAMLGVLIFDTLPGLFIGIAVSILLLIYRASYPHVATLGKVAGSDQFTDVDRHPENATVAGVVIVRVDGSLFFANADSVAAAIRAHAKAPGVRAVILDAEAIPFVDISAVNALKNASQSLKTLGVRLVVAHDLGQVRDLFRVGGADHLLDNVYPTVQAAVEAVT
jgi:sulfate permease, SulP family